MQAYMSGLPQFALRREFPVSHIAIWAVLCPDLLFYLFRTQKNFKSSANISHNDPRSRAVVTLSEDEPASRRRHILLSLADCRFCMPKKGQFWALSNTGPSKHVVIRSQRCWSRSKC